MNTERHNIACRLIMKAKAFLQDLWSVLHSMITSSTDHLAK